MRTRTTLQLLDPTRRTVIVKTLFQANLLRNIWKSETSILYKANVSGVHFGQPSDRHTYGLIAMDDFPDIEHADVRYASFRSVFFNSSPSFAYSNLDYTDWSFSELDLIDFHNEMTMNNAIFAESQLVNVAFDAIPMNQISFEHNKHCLKCMFLETSLLGARLNHSKFVQSLFGSLSIADGNMSNGSFVESTFENVTLDRVDLSGADLRQCIFRHVSMVNCSMFGVKLQEAKFFNVNLTGCIGLQIEQILSLPTNNEVTLPNATLLLSRKTL
jgi:uncharacterized protein YjbI with pentapeptide repeats